MLVELSWLVAGLGIVVASVAACLARRISAGLPLAVEFWLASGLLRLSVDETWSALALAAAVVLTRKVLVEAIEPCRARSPASRHCNAKARDSGR